MKRILFISTLEAAPWGGSEELWHYMAANLLDDGHTVGVARIEWTPVPPKLEELVSKGAQILYRPNIHVPRKATDLSFHFRRLRHRRAPMDDIERFGADVIVINQGGNFDAYLERLSPFLAHTSIPYHIICHHAYEHGYLGDYHRKIFQQIFSKAAGVFFVSRRNKESTEHILAARIPAAAVFYHPPVTIRAATLLPFPAGPTIRLACTARLDVHFKGQDMLIRVLSAPDWKARDWHLDLYGDGPNRQYLEELVRFYGLEDRIALKGHVTDIQSVWQNHHLLILPSHSEGTPLALYEASLYGRPAVATDVGGGKEVIIEGETGFIAEAPTVTALNTALQKAWQQQDRWEEMGARAKKRVTEMTHVSYFDEIIKRIVS